MLKAQKANDMKEIFALAPQTMPVIQLKFVYLLCF